jgi:hypothetical protein
MSSAPEFTAKQIAAAEAKIKARKQFESVFPLLVEEIVQYLETIHLPDNAVEWYKEVFPPTYNHVIWN